MLFLSLTVAYILMNINVVEHFLRFEAKFTGALKEKPAWERSCVIPVDVFLRRGVSL